jgi:hypothetical protein
MQVSQIAELDTHAVIGGGKAQSFGMADTAEFFTILSDTLYRDKVRAVAREVICNAWDAHVIAGKTDVPVEITLTETELVIKDFGPGIADDRIVPIYCVFGASTKAKDETQTGGFGLGSKAPFAYSDHFSVTSCHDGSRIVYAISRGGVETDGKPDIRAMVKVPTKDTGITVTIPIKSPADRRAFETAILAVVRQGGILANFNGKKAQTIDYTGGRKLGFQLIEISYEMRLSEAHVYALYGTVLYPVSSSDREIIDAVRKLDGLTGNRSRLVIICPPNSIGVTPSRESISYTERTKATILGLLEKVFQVLKREVKPAALALIRERATKQKRHQINLNSLKENTYFESSNSSDLKVVAKQIAASRIGHFVTASETARAALYTYAKSFRDERRSFRRLAGSVDRHDRDALYRIGPMTERYERRLYVRMAAKLGLLDKLMVHHHNTYGADVLMPIGRSRSYDRSSVKLVVSPNQREGIAAARTLQNGRSYGEPKLRVLVLVLGRKNRELVGKIEAECKRLKLNYTMLDFGAAPLPKKKREFAFYQLSQIGEHAQLVGDPSLNEAPVFINVNGGAKEIAVPGLTPMWRQLALKLYPKIALARTVIQTKKLEEQGSRPLFEVMIEEVRKAADREDLQYVSMIDRGLMPGSGGRVIGKARALSRLNLDFARIFFPASITLGKDIERLRSICTILFDGNTYLPKPYAESMRYLREELTLATMNRFEKVFPIETLLRRFAPLHFVDVPASLSAGETAELRALIHFLMKTEDPAKKATPIVNAKSTPKPKPTSNTQPLKEAA